MAAAEAYDLDIFQVRIFSGNDSGSEHSRMVVVDDIETAVGEIHVVDARNGICGEDRNAETREHLRKVVVDQRIILVRSRGEDHGVAVLLCDLF